MKMNNNNSTQTIRETDYINPSNLRDRYSVRIDKKQFPTLVQIQESIQEPISQLLLAKACEDMEKDARYYSDIRNYLSRDKSEGGYIQEYHQLEQLLGQTPVGDTHTLQD